jgi:hypothetical protein
MPGCDNPSQVQAQPLLSAEEQGVVDALADAWNRFLAIEPLHSDNIDEFRHGIHQLQHLVMARPVQRYYNKEIQMPTARVLTEGELLDKLEQVREYLAHPDTDDEDSNIAEVMSMLQVQRGVKPKPITVD